MMESICGLMNPSLERSSTCGGKNSFNPNFETASDSISLSNTFLDSSVQSRFVISRNDSITPSQCPVSYLRLRSDRSHSFINVSCSDFVIASLSTCRSSSTLRSLRLLVSINDDVDLLEYPLLHILLMMIRGVIISPVSFWKFETVISQQQQQRQQQQQSNNKTLSMNTMKLNVYHTYIYNNYKKKITIMNTISNASLVDIRSEPLTSDFQILT